MKPLKHIKKGIEAYKKSKADDVAAAAKKAKEAEEKAKQAKKLADAKAEGIAIGKKQKAKSIKRKATATAAAGGAGYVEYKTGAISAGAKKAYAYAKDKYDKRNAKPQTHSGAPSKAKAGLKESLQGPRGGAKEIIKKAKSTAKKQTKPTNKKK